MENMKGLIGGRVVVATAQPSSVRIFQRTRWPSGSDMDVGRFGIQFRGKKGKIYLFSIGSGSDAAGEVP